MAVSVIGFDFDNTVADTLPVMCAAVNAVLRDLGAESQPCRPDDLETRTPLEFLRSHGGISAKPNLYWGALVERMTEMRLFQGVQDLLIGLKPRIPIGLQTSLPRSIMERALDVLAIRASFFRVIAYGDVPHPKPSPDGIIDLAAHAGVPPLQVLFVGDRTEDIQAASSCRAISGLALWSRGDHRAALAERPNYVFRSPAEILNLL